MCKKLIVLVCLLAMTSSAWAGGGIWFGSAYGGDTSWDTAASWQNGAAPTSAECAYIDSGWAVWGEPVIDDGIDAVALQVIVGWSALSTGDVTLHMDGGSLTTPDLWLGLGAPLANHGTFDMTDGTVTVSSTLAVGWDGSGTINMSGGTINVTGNLALPLVGGYAEINLYDGLIDVTGGFSPTDGLYHIEIQEGTMKIAGDYEALVYHWALNMGQWTGYGDPANIVANYDAGSGVTTVTAIPEPATMVLLSLGGLALLRRKLQ